MVNVAYCRRVIAWFTRHSAQLIRGGVLQVETSLIVGEPRGLTGLMLDDAYRIEH